MLLSSSYLSYSQILWWCNFREALLTLCLHIFQPGNRRDLKEDTRQFYAEIDLEVKTLFIWRLIVFLLFYTFNVFPWTKTYILFFSIFGLWHEARSYGWFFSGCWNVNHQQKSFKGLPKFSFFFVWFSWALTALKHSARPSIAVPYLCIKMPDSYHIAPC